MVVPAIFAAFGAVCGVYLSAAGFMITAVVTVAVLGISGGVVGGPFSAGLLFTGFVAMQVGFAACVSGRVMGPHLWRMRTGLSSAGRARTIVGKPDTVDRHSH